jgi:lipoprotein-releasing system ATP-binding protein
MSSYLEIRGLAKTYPSGDSSVEVLNGLSLSLEKGAMLAVTGESGCGKSTLLHLVGGMEKPDAGSVLLEGEDVCALEGEALARMRNLKIGFVFQFHHLLPEFTAEENAMFPLLIRGVGANQARSRARALLDQVGLAARGQHRPGELSGGEQQRVAIARALAGSPSLLLADEPTGNLDTNTSTTIHRLLQEIHQEHKLTSIIVTHNRSLAAGCPERRQLVGGRLVNTPF